MIEANIGEQEIEMQEGRKAGFFAASKRYKQINLEV
jgi:hypothetical protein